jgi:hypothetical protein
LGEGKALMGSEVGTLMPIVHFWMSLVVCAEGFVITFLAFWASPPVLIEKVCSSISFV